MKHENLDDLLPVREGGRLPSGWWIAPACVLGGIAWVVIALGVKALFGG